MVERGAGLQIERGAAKPVCHAGADQEGIAEHKGLPASRQLDCILAERISEEIARMPANNGIFQGCMLWGVGGGRSRRLRRQARKSITVPAGQRADDADEAIGVAEIEKRGLQLGERLGKSFEPITRGAALGGRKRTFERRIRINVAGVSIDIAYQEPPEPRFYADGQPVAVLIVKHLVCSRRADTNSCHGKKGNTDSAMSYPRHLPPLPWPARYAIFSL